MVASRPSPSVLVVLAVLAVFPRAAQATQVELISAADPTMIADSGGTLSNVGGFGVRTVSADGRFTVFTSEAANLVPGQVDTNKVSDVFLYDRTAGALTLVSHTPAGPAAAGNAVSDQAAISADGAFVAFVSRASNLVPGQAETGASDSQDIFLWDRATGAVTLVSHSTAGSATTTTADSGGPLALSDDGRWLVFFSVGSDLVAGQVGPVGIKAGVYLYDRTSGGNTLVSHAAGSATTLSDGTSEPQGLSADGRWLAYVSTATNLVAGFVGTGGADSNVYLWDRTTGASTLVSHTPGQPAHGGNAPSGESSLSADGRFVAYQTVASNLLAGVTDTNSTLDVVVWDRDTDTNQLVDHPAGSTTTTPARASSTPVISADGAWILFLSDATDLIAGQAGNGRFIAGLFLTERATGATVLVSHANGAPAALAAGGGTNAPSVSADGRWIAYSSAGSDIVANDANGSTSDVFLYDRTTGTNSAVSHDAGSAATANAVSLNQEISADGSTIAFASFASDLDAAAQDTNGTRDVFLHDRAAGTGQLVSRRAAALPSATAGGDSSITNYPRPTVSPDGRWVAFTSEAQNLVAGQADLNRATDVFLRDRTTGTTILVSHAAGSPATTGNGASLWPAVTPDGRYVAYTSLATDLVPGQVDGNSDSDVFLFDRTTGTNTLVSHVAASAVTTGNRRSDTPSLALDGSRVAFQTLATNLLPGITDSNAWTDAYLWDAASGALTLISHAAGAPTTTGSQSSGGPMILADGTVLYGSEAANLAAGQADTNGQSDVFLWDPAANASTLVSHVSGAPSTAGNSRSLSYVASADSRWIAFSSRATNLLPGVTDVNGIAVEDAYLFDRQAGALTLISHAAGSPSQTATGGASWVSDISAGGRWVAYTSSADDLVAGQSAALLDNGFLWDRESGTSVLVTHAPGQPIVPGSNATGALRLSADSTLVAYASASTNLVSELNIPGPAFGYRAYVYDRAADANALVSRSFVSPTLAGNGLSSTVEIAAGGTAIVFQSSSSDLVPGDLNGRDDVFVYSNGVVGAYTTITPCRLLDTRQPPAGSAIFSGQTRVVQVHNLCGIPETAKAVALNVTVVLPSGDGYLTFHPGDLAPAATSTINFSAGQVRANNAIQRLALNAAGTIAVTPTVAGNGTVQVVIDVAGYFE